MSPIDLNLTLDRTPAAARMARGALLPLRSQLGEEHFSDLRVIVSELVANATAHGAGDDIRLALTVEDTGVVRGRVEDDGPSRAIAPRPDCDAVDEGLGLLIVDTLASTWGIDEVRPGVWFEIEPPPGEHNVAAAGREIGEELSGLHAQIYDEEARLAEVLLAEDAVVVLLDGVAPEREADRDEDAIEATFRAAIERILGRSVVAFSSFTKADPGCVCQVFRLAPLRGSHEWVGAQP